MEVDQNMMSITATWRGRQLDVKVGENSTFEELGKKLQELTGVEPYTMRLLVPVLGSKASKLVTPFSAEHSCLKLQEMDVAEGKPIRMMGAFNDEIEKVSQNSMNPDLRILGFDEEEKRLRQRSVDGPRASLKLPQGPYVFCDFRTLHLPGIKLTPPPSEALRRMHMLACDPGIVAIMNKHRWRVGVMTEMAPEGYVGVSPVCLLGFNKNQGEEISLRLRTDDLKGFRKYERIKETLLHELAHMVHSEHDANFYALDKQLNHEAATLDWTKSTSHTLSGRKFSDHFEDDVHVAETNYSGQKLGGTWASSDTARSSSVAAAYNRLLNRFTNDLDGSQVPTGGVDEAAEPDPDDGEVKDGLVHSLSKELDAAAEPDPDDGEVQLSLVKMLEPDPDDELANENHNMHIDVTPSRNHASSGSSMRNSNEEPDPDDCLNSERMFEPDPDDCINSERMFEPDPDDCLNSERMFEPDPDDSHAEEKAVSRDEPDPDDSTMKTFRPEDNRTINNVDLNHQNTFEPDPDDSGNSVIVEDESKSEDVPLENEYRLSNFGGVLVPDDRMDESGNQELQIIDEPVAAICSRLQKSIEMLRSEVPPAEATAALQTLFKIIRNAIDHPDEVKYKRLRKANPQFQRNVGNHKAAMELLTVVGFCEDVLSDEVGRAETYLVLKRNDPGLLWLAKSSLEFSIA